MAKRKSKICMGSERMVWNRLDEQIMNNFFGVDDPPKQNSKEGYGRMYGNQGPKW